MVQPLPSVLFQRRWDAGATYSAEVIAQEATETYKLFERPIYGSSRVGMFDNSWLWPQKSLEMTVTEE